MNPKCAAGPMIVTVLALVSRGLLAAPAALPGDRGRPLDGLPPPTVQPGAMPARAAKVRKEIAAPPLSLALTAAFAIAEGCKQFPLGIAVVDSVGTPKLIYVPDGSEGWHGYSAVRKAWTAVAFKMPTIELAAKARDNPELQARIRVDPNFQAFAGARPWRVRDTIVGAIGVSGAEPGGHDDECVQIGLEKIKGAMK